MAASSRQFVNASSQYIHRDLAVPIVPTGAWTLAAWIRPVSAAAYATVISVGLSSDINRSISMYRKASGVLRAKMDGHTTLTGSASVPLNDWTHAMLIRENNALKLYTNGADEQAGSSATPTAFSPDRIAIGCLLRATTVASRFFDGLIFWPAVWGTALGSTDRAALAAGADPATVASASRVLQPDLATLAEQEAGGVWTDEGGSTASDTVPPFAAVSVPAIANYYRRMRCS